MKARCEEGHLEISLQHPNCQTEIMIQQNTPPQSSADPVPALVAQVYAEAPPALRSRLLESLLRPLSLLSLVAVANGAFAKLALPQGWPRLPLSVDDAHRIDTKDLIALVNHVQQVSGPAVEELSRIVSSNGMLGSSAAAAMLITLLTKRALQRPSAPVDDFDPIL